LFESAHATLHGTGASILSKHCFAFDDSRMTSS
jgi:hypothetical protein